MPDTSSSRATSAAHLRPGAGCLDRVTGGEENLGLGGKWVTGKGHQYMGDKGRIRADEMDTSGTRNLQFIW